MYEVWKITQGVMNMIDSQRDEYDARRIALEQSALHEAVYIVVRQGFGAALYAVWQGVMGDPVEVIRRMSAAPVQPRAILPDEKPAGSTGSTRPEKPRSRRKGPEETKGRKWGASEHKIVPATVISVDETLGIVEAVVNTYGIIDDGEDRVWYGSAAKTLAENFGRVRVLNSHNNRNVLDVVGKPLVMRELMRDELPPEIQMKWSTATGGLYTKTQYLIDTPEGLGVFKRIAAGAVDEYSIGFDAIVTDMERMPDPVTGKQRTIRNIREIRLWEYSPVVWGMNPATTSISAKSADVKPYAVFPMNDEYCVFKVDGNGERVGDSLGCHPTEGEANDQVAALYAAETDKARKEYTPDGPVKRIGDCLLAELLGEGTETLVHWLEEGLITPAEYNLLLQPLTTHLNAFYAAIPQDIALREYVDPYAAMMSWFSGDDPDETKVGRVLSERNYNAIKQAHELLTTVMESAGLTDGDTAINADKSRNDDATDGPLPASTNAPTPDDGAGPQEHETPATKQAVELLRQRLAQLGG